MEASYPARRVAQQGELPAQMGQTSALFIWNRVTVFTIDILYTLDSASNYSAIQKLKP